MTNQATAPSPLALMGVPGSPYTRKMLAVLRYRRIPYKLILAGSGRFPEGYPRPKVQLLPTFFLPNAAGDMEAVVDSTPLIRRFEAEFSGRAVIPNDPALAFLDYLLEDYADEWLTKAMFHYRWHYQADIERAGSILPRWTLDPQAEDVAVQMGKVFAERQISRLHVVGSSPETAPIIEASYERYLAVMRAHLETSAFLLGARPGSGDFAAYGQLTQLAKFDPTPMALTFEKAPVVFAWTDMVDDLSGMEPADADWTDRTAIPDTVRAIFREIGTYYVPALRANAEALMSGADKVETEIDGARWIQQPFPYQGKCLQWIRAEHDKLSDADRKVVDDVLAGTGCEKLFA
ncbi:MAG: glutathione S-transferase [Parvibaculaceae bacterium]|jgi:glutathione S-transferase|nr:glutathione S-transferase N-terminal domain-containing protein [Parvibaculaceae bacterium]